MMSSLGEELPNEITRVRDHVLPAYLEVVKISPLTEITIGLIRADLDHAVKALAESDAVECIRAYKTLKGWTA